MPNPYGHDHRKARALALPRWVGQPCPCPGCRKCQGRCLVILTAKNAQWDHAQPVVLGGTAASRFLCASCNTSRGATLGNRLRGRIAAHLPHSGTV